MKKLSIILAIIRGMIFRVLHQENIIHPRIYRGGVKLIGCHSLILKGVHIGDGAVIEERCAFSFSRWRQSGKGYKNRCAVEFTWHEIVIMKSFNGNAIFFCLWYRQKVIDLIS